MMKEKRSQTALRTLFFCLAAALLTVLLMESGILHRQDQWAADSLYQRPRALSRDIVLIGIDDKALEKLGPYHQWSRNIMAAVLEKLAEDPAKKPAVTAVDVLYSGEGIPEEDERLAAAAEKLGNVVTATLAEYGEEIHWKNGRATGIDHFAVLRYEEPYKKLRDVTFQGHINAMYDRDGIMRHGQLYVEVPKRLLSAPETEHIYSMAAVTARIFLAERGENLTLPETNARGQFYIAYSSQPGDYYDGVSVVDILEGNVPSDYFAGKIVLIGPYASALQDAYYTPVDRAKQMYGIETQANVIQAILENRFPKEVPDALQGIVLFLVSFVAMLVFVSIPAAAAAFSSAGLMAVSVWGTGVLYRQNLILHPLWVPVSFALLLIISIVYRYFLTVSAHRRVTHIFERYVGPEILREILKEGEDKLTLGGKSCEIAVLFADIRGFTAMAEQLDSEKVVPVLNRFLEISGRCIERNRGTLDKYIGDGVMAFWGAPVLQEDSVYLAVKTAMEIMEEANVLSGKLQEEIGQELHVGIGIHYGTAVVGNMGFERRMDYTAIGDTVNTASRLEAAATPETIFISKSVADALGDRAVCRSLGNSIALRGKTEDFEVLVLESLK